MPELTKMPEKSQRPSENAYWQQKLTSWDPVMTPFTVIMLLSTVGLIFLPIGVTMLYSANNLYNQSIQYGGDGTAVANSCPGGSCLLNFKIDQKIDGKLYLYYELDNYYQNNIKYSSSVNWDQMMGKIDIPMETLESSCDPAAVSNSTITLNPCGLIAKSYFTDSYGINLSTSSVGGTAPTALTALEMKFGDITGSIDTSLFVQPDGFKSEDVPVGTKCENGKTMLPDVCKDAGLSVGCKCYQNPADATQYSYFYYPFDETTLYLYEMYPQSLYGGISPLVGVTDPHFMNWMNIAALPNFRKLYGVIDVNVDVGDILSFAVSSLVDVNSFQGKKSLVLSARGSLGVSNPGLGITYIVTGGACLLFSFVFFLKQEFSPRPLPTPASLNWTK